MVMATHPAMKCNHIASGMKTWHFILDSRKKHEQVYANQVCLPNLFMKPFLPFMQSIYFFFFLWRKIEIHFCFFPPFFVFIFFSFSFVKYNDKMITCLLGNLILKIIILSVFGPPLQTVLKREIWDLFYAHFVQCSTSTKGSTNASSDWFWLILKIKQDWVWWIPEWEASRNIKNVRMRSWGMSCKKSLPYIQKTRWI